jgi:AraC family transcriptional regulator, regulatory protein of adaptative response / methylated-DNA-[protein]-cysteine methyltransferase
MHDPTTTHPLEHSVRDCAWGRMLLVTRGDSIVMLLLGDSDEPLLQEQADAFPKRAPRRAAGDGHHALAVRAQLALRSTAKPHSLPLHPEGTDFQQRVWSHLQRIPAGSTTTYAAIAAELGDDNLVRAVGQACGANPIAVLIPCHRVLRSDGDLAGYRWGIERKRALLTAEGALAQASLF